MGHLIPLTVGHKNKPTEVEAKYIRSIINMSDFRYIPEDFQAVSPTTLNVGLASALIPPILPSPNVIIKGSLSHRTLYKNNQGFLKLHKNNKNIDDSISSFKSCKSNFEVVEIHEDLVSLKKSRFIINLHKT